MPKFKLQIRFPQYSGTGYLGTVIIEATDELTALRKAEQRTEHWVVEKISD